MTINYSLTLDDKVIYATDVENLPAVLTPSDAPENLKAWHSLICANCGKQAVNGLSGFVGNSFLMKLQCFNCGIGFQTQDTYNIIDGPDFNLMYFQKEKEQEFLRLFYEAKNKVKQALLFN